MIKIDAKKLQDRLTKLQAKLKNPLPLMSKIGAVLVDDTKNRIAVTKVDPQGRPWAPWSFKTMKSKRLTGASLLYQTGDLYRSITAKIMGKKVFVTSSVPYAKYHQYGTSKMPARPFFGASQIALREIKRLMTQYFTEK